MSTANKIKERLSQDQRFWKRGGSEYIGNAPAEIRTGSDGMSFHVVFEGDEFGWYKDFKGISGSLYELAGLLGIPTPKKTAARDTLIINSLKAYAESMGMDEDYLLNKGWEQGMHENRPCIFVPNESGWRQVRFLDGNKPKWKPEPPKLETDEDGKAKLAFYGTVAAKKIAKAAKLNFLVLVNGASSVEALQYRGVPAFAIVGGEQNIARKIYTDRILKAWNQSILIALDCDKVGQDSAAKFSQLFGERGIVIDLQGTDGFDGADFAALWRDSSLARLKQLANEADASRPARTAHEAADAVIAMIEGKRPQQGRDIPMPFGLLHRFGGGAKFMKYNLMTGVVGLSGHGKTAFWQTMVKDLLTSPRKWGIMVDSREFTVESDHVRRMQGEAKQFGLKISQDIIDSHLVWMQEEKEGVPAAQRFGVQMRPEMIDELKNLNSFMKMSWQGHLEFAEEYPYIEDTLDYMKRRTLEIREQGGNMDLWILDYLTLYKATSKSIDGTGKNLYAVITQMIKDAARSVHVHVILMLQPTKAPTADALVRNERLKETDIAYTNVNDFNAVIALNTLYGNKAKWESGFDNLNGGGAWTIEDYDPATGKPMVGMARLRSGAFAAIVEVLKNTNGEKGFTPMQADFGNLQWLNEGWSESDLCLPLKGKEE